ncbi:GMC family oxidoreductase [Aspergillus saccharolyticus JOP 1030-1]|uniref:Putative GMC oxidoreductase n=1 Tax=Aspergillus saccharolyticus JOP 1030-1 TaxID=1450539 RepID=A0A318ZJ56_9EURO|nr:putative GMC oxidoreductase [Aspergillus saccharolyticus JOP 1030-1]PYH40288.1 putative GMC oxidoreductase [Aspergillus saccharolyticus JOP 1030-1]
MHVSWLLSSLATVAIAQEEDLNLFDYGRRGPLIGTSFGIPGVNETFDYIVIGGGTAGLTIASRLAQSDRFSVAVIEAGGFYEIDNGNQSVVPAYTKPGATSQTYNPLNDWGFKTQPQQALNGQVFHYTQGKGLGGNSAKNSMNYNRPTNESMRRWAEEVGDESYTFDRMLPYYKKSVRYTPPDPAIWGDYNSLQNTDAFDNGGPLEVSSGNWVEPMGLTMHQVLTERFGLAVTEFNSGSLIGSGFMSQTVNPRNAHRSSSESSFLQQALDSGSKLTVYKSTLAQKILFNGGNKAASEVLVTTAGTFGTPNLDFFLRAREEIIVSAGAIQSPQLLMVSGIGECEQLSRYGIPCISHLPGVGKNLQDHPAVITACRANVSKIPSLISNEASRALHVRQYLEKAQGPLTSASTGYFGFEKLPQQYRAELSNETLVGLADFPMDWPEIEWTGPSLSESDEIHEQSIALGSIVQATFSRGLVSLASPDMSTPPIIDPQWLADPRDMHTSIQAFRRSREVWAHLAELGVIDLGECFPGSEVKTDNQIREFLRQHASAINHGSCTCKMGSKSDVMAVIDSAAQVYGVQRLRVVDASSFPFLPPGHPQSTVYALAEKIADAILRAKDSSSSQ